jgi:hypothetical protein
MAFSGLRSLVVLFCAIVVAGSPAYAQSGGDKPADQQKAGEAKHRIDVIAEAGRVLTGPAATPECTWLGTRVINLLARDDLDTAFRHLDLYDRFGCPGAHIQTSFRCLARQGEFDPKGSETLDERVKNCWLNPTSAPQAPAPPAAPPAAPAAPPAAPAAPSAGTGAH